MLEENICNCVLPFERKLTFIENENVVFSLELCFFYYRAAVGMLEDAILH